MSVEMQIVSRYLWRGFDLGVGKPALQGYGEVRVPAGLGFSAWASSALDRHTQLDEIQLGATYGRTIGDWEAGLGYLAYLLPGTETEPNPGPDPMAWSESGEISVYLARNWESGSVWLTYSRGHGNSRGNSLNLWAQRVVPLGKEGWTVEPTFEADYLDEYDAPGGLAQRLTQLHLALPLAYTTGSLRFAVEPHLTAVPSDFVREANRSVGGSARTLVPWFAVTLTWEPN